MSCKCASLRDSGRSPTRGDGGTSVPRWINMRFPSVSFGSSCRGGMYDVVSNSLTCCGRTSRRIVSRGKNRPFNMRPPKHLPGFPQPTLGTNMKEPPTFFPVMRRRASVQLRYQVDGEGCGRGEGMQHGHLSGRKAVGSRLDWAGSKPCSPSEPSFHSESLTSHYPSRTFSVPGI